MKKFRFLSLILLFALVLTVFAPSAAALDDPTVDAYGAVLMAIDGDTATTLYTKNEQDLVYPASLTKIMTVLLAVEAIEAGTVGLNDPVTAMPDFNFDQIEGGSTIWMGLGEVMPLEDLLYAAMVASANEVCNVIAQYIGGSIPAFVEMIAVINCAFCEVDRDGCGSDLERDRGCCPIDYVVIISVADCECGIYELCRMLVINTNVLGRGGKSDRERACVVKTRYCALINYECDLSAVVNCTVCEVNGESCGSDRESDRGA